MANLDILIVDEENLPVKQKVQFKTFKKRIRKFWICDIIHCMNNFHSRRELYYPRWVASLLRKAVEYSPVTVLTGARQVGKSTLLLKEEPFRNWPFRTLDDYDLLEQAKQEPESLWAGTNRVILDEVQKAPELLTAVKQTVDLHPGKYHFVLSGSANLLLMRQVSESLAGRALYFILNPLTLGEIHQVKPPEILERILENDWPEEANIKEYPPEPVPLMLRGLMPTLQRIDTVDSWVRWWDGYVTTYLERDMRQISKIDALVDFRRMMELLALRSAQLINQSEIARDSQLSQPTTHRYLNILETTHLFERLPAFTTSHTTRILKSPKAFWVDPGLAVFLSGYYHEEEVSKARECGAYFETLIYHHLRVLAQLMTPPAKLFFWRTMGGKEVDFIIEHGRKVLAIEVKQTTRPGFGDIGGLRAFLNDYPQASGGLLLHGGTEIKRMAQNILALPWNVLTG